ncbi:MAG: DNA gyrase/topoisomerase IV subunit A, partial [Paludibacteraceae bacterium]|nr:DNA gyrase/topoisomerase IV subunit A [Paludibacteraceae bacterium]
FDVTAKPTSFIGDNPNSRILLITSTVYPHLKVNFGGNDSQRTPMEIDFGVEEFIAVKGVKAKGKRIHPSWVVGDVVELEPTKVPEPEPEPEEEDPETSADDVDDNDDNSNLPTDENGQLTLF